MNYVMANLEPTDRRRLMDGLCHALDGLPEDVYRTLGRILTVSNEATPETAAAASATLRAALEGLELDRLASLHVEVGRLHDVFCDLRELVGTFMIARAVEGLTRQQAN